MRNHEPKNYTKVKVLMFLGAHAGYLYSTREIADRANVKIGSLYVLLERWASWDYVHCDQRWTDKEHKLYSIGSKGKAYLRSLPKWFELLDKAREDVRIANRHKIGFNSNGTWHILALDPIGIENRKGCYYTTDRMPRGLDVVARGPESLFKLAKDLYKFGFSLEFQEKVLVQIKGAGSVKRI